MTGFQTPQVEKVSLRDQVSQALRAATPRVSSPMREHISRTRGRWAHPPQTADGEVSI